MSNQIETPARLAGAFYTAVPKQVAIPMASWGPSRSNVADFQGGYTRTTMVHSMEIRGSIYMCSIGGIEHNGFFQSHLKPRWGSKIHEAIKRAKVKDMANDTAEKVDANFLRHNPNGYVTVEVRVDLVPHDSPINPWRETLLRCVITAAAPERRKQPPKVFLRKEIKVLLTAATYIGMINLGQHYGSFFGPDWKDDDPIPF